MNRVAFFSVLVVFLSCQVAIAGETITAQEVESYFYADGEMKRDKGTFESTYYLEETTITRTRVYNRTTKEVIPDDTVYQIQRQLKSDPSKGLSLSGKPIIRAIGQPGSDAVEILMIGDAFIQSVKSTADYFVISRYKRIK